MTPSPTPSQNLNYLHQTITLAKQSPPQPTNFRVGCVLVSFPSSSDPTVLSTGYTLELPGNTHAEQNALAKLLLSRGVVEEEIGTLFPAAANVVLYTSLEPCGLRLSGNKACVQRIIDTRRGGGNGIRKVVFGAKEPRTFVEDSRSCQLLSEAGVEWEYIPDLEEEILRVAMEGHGKKDQGGMEKEDLHSRVDAAMGMSGDTDKKKGEMSEEEKRRQQEAEAQPRNPKKRMMEYVPQ